MPNCNKVVCKGRRSYCSQECAERFAVAYFPADTRAAVHRRDKGVCRACGCDTDKLRRIQTACTRLGGGRSAAAETAGLLGFGDGWGVGHSGRFWQVDHIFEVARGGWGVGLDQLRTLCTVCHKAETARLASELAQERRELEMEFFDCQLPPMKTDLMIQGLLPGVPHNISWSPAKMRSVIRSPIKSHGGKFYMSESILNVCAPAMGATNVWVEATAGGANTSLQATHRPGIVQIVMDKDPYIANVWRSMRKATAVRLIQRLQAVNVEDRQKMEREFFEATIFMKMVKDTVYNTDFESWDDDFRIGLAAATIINSRMSRGGMGESFCWQDRNRGGQPGEINSWKNFVWNHAPRVAERVQEWLTFKFDAMNGLNELDDPKQFHYFDPPYMKETRTATDVYRHDEFPHELFIPAVVGRKAKIAISGYRHGFYDQHLTPAAGWTRHDFRIINHSGQNKVKQQRTECLYVNF